jgi:hypothetical protein
LARRPRQAKGSTQSGCSTSAYCPGWVGTAGSASESVAKPAPVLATGEPLPPLRFSCYCGSEAGPQARQTKPPFAAATPRLAQLRCGPRGWPAQQRAGARRRWCYLPGGEFLEKCRPSRGRAQSRGRRLASPHGRREGGPPSRALKTHRDVGWCNEKSRLYSIKQLKFQSCADRGLLPQLGLAILKVGYPALIPG